MDTASNITQMPGKRAPRQLRRETILLAAIGKAFKQVFNRESVKVGLEIEGGAKVVAEEVKPGVINIFVTMDGTK